MLQQGAKADCCQQVNYFIRFMSFKKINDNLILNDFIKEYGEF